MAPTFCLVRVFWMAETKAPAPVVIMIAFVLAPMASFGWYGSSSWLSDEAMVQAGVVWRVADCE